MNYNILYSNVTYFKDTKQKCKGKGKGKVIPLQARCGPEGG